MDTPTLTLVGYAVTLVATILGGSWYAARRAAQGKAEDIRLAKRDQAWDEVTSVSESRRQQVLDRDQEIKDLRAEKLAERVEHERIREHERAERERQVTALEARLDRQYARCRRITEAFVSAISAKSPDAANVAEQAAKQHFFDHDWGAGDHPPPSDGARGERT